MKIIILGAGHTGSSIACSLVKEGNDVVMIDLNPERLRELQDSVDIATVTGAGTYPGSFQRANMQDADLLIAMLHRDEDNIAACQIAWALYQPPFIAARIRNSQYLDYPQLFSKENIPIDALISPESLVTQYVQSIIEYPGVRQLHDFNNGLLKLVSLDVQTDARVIDRHIDELAQLSPDIQWLGRLKGSRIITFQEDDTVLQENDKLLFIVPGEKLNKSISLFKNKIKPYKRIIIAGGGHVGKRMAVSLQDNYKVKVIEKDLKRARCLAENLENTMVLGGDATDPDLLTNEGISDSDVFCALTSSDEANILSSMMAKKLGVRETICLVNKSAYVDMILSSVIDIVFSPEKITSAHVLRYVRRGGIINVCPLHGSDIDIVELVVEGSQERSRVIGLQVSQLDLPEGVSVGAITRGDELLRLENDVVIEARDHLIMAVPIKQMADVEKYFQVSLV